MHKKFNISFSPNIGQINQIEKWLIQERNKTGEGFYCNWDVIEPAFKDYRLVTISIRNKVVGFATFRITSNKTVELDIVEVKPSYRKKGVAKFLISEIFKSLIDRGIYVVTLQCAPENSESYWKSLGFLEYHKDIHSDYNYTNKHLYKILVEYSHPVLLKDIEEDSLETIDLWDVRSYKIDRYTPIPPVYRWNLHFKGETRDLVTPIIYPINREWKVKISNKDGIIEHEIRYTLNKFKLVYGDFLIIENFPKMTTEK